MKQIAASLGALALALAPRPAAADAPPASASADHSVVAGAVLAGPAPASAYAFGARAGGYGFRNTAHADAGAWDDCRMGGLGVFAQRALTPVLFAEAAFDLYTARDARPTPEMPVVGMDRISGITTVAAGARAPWRWVSPFVQLGVGLEVTRVEMPGHDPRRDVVPMGFFGVGADLRVTPTLSLGGQLRSNVMRHYEHDHAVAGGEMTTEAEAAMQGQLFVKYQP